MRAGAMLRVGCALLWLAGSGCTSLHEIPRGEYTARPERQRLRVVTREGLVYEFDSARFVADSLYGFRRRDVEGAFDEFATVGLALTDIERLSARGVDWRRTGLIGGGIAAAVVAVGLARRAAQNNGSDSGGGRVLTP